jgi:hypothetical protein
VIDRGLATALGLEWAAISSTESLDLAIFRCKNEKQNANNKFFNTEYVAEL